MTVPSSRCWFDSSYTLQKEIKMKKLLLILLLLSPFSLAHTDEQASQAIKKAKESWESTNNVVKRAFAIAELSKTQHKKVANVLSRFTKMQLPIAMAAMIGLSNQPYDRQVKKFLLKELKYFKRKHMVQHMAIVLRVLKKYKCPLVVRALISIFNYHKYEVVVDAIQSLGFIGDKGVVYKLILLLEDILPDGCQKRRQGRRHGERSHHHKYSHRSESEQPREGTGDAWEHSKGCRARKNDKERFQHLFGPIIAVLRKLTGQKFQTASQWRRWYNSLRSAERRNFNKY